MVRQPQGDAVSHRRVREGKTNSSKNWEKTYFDWMENIQRVHLAAALWGHQIPAWYARRQAGSCRNEEEAVSGRSLLRGNRRDHDAQGQHATHPDKATPF